MDIATEDSFSASHRSQLIERKHFVTSFVWKIASVNSRAKYVGDKIISPLFHSCRYVSWRLSIYPKGEPKSPFYPYLLLSCKAENEAVYCKAYVKFTILDKDGNKLHEDTGRKYTFCHTKWNQDIALNARRGSELNASLLTIDFSICVEEDSTPDFSLKEATLVCKGKNKPQKYANKNSILSGDDDTLSSCDDPTAEKEDIAALLADIESLHTSPSFADVTLKLKDLEFPAHKVILISRSKVFKAMFEHDMKENRQDTVDLVDMEVTTVKDMLRYIYCGKLRQMSPEEALNLYVAADRYDLPGLVLRCRKIVLSGLSIDNICEISVVADLHNDQLLLGAVRALLCNNMKKVFKTDKWMIFAEENPKLSLNLIQSAVLNS